MTERYGKYWRGDRKRDVELLKEEEQVAVLDRVDKAQTSQRLSTQQSLLETQHGHLSVSMTQRKGNRTVGKKRVT